jgi:hypothetical protein
MLPSSALVRSIHPFSFTAVIVTNCKVYFACPTICSRKRAKDAQWETYDHDKHGFIYVQRNDRGEYEPDALQMRDSISFFDRHLKST